MSTEIFEEKMFLEFIFVILSLNRKLNSIKVIEIASIEEIISPKISFSSNTFMCVAVTVGWCLNHMIDISILPIALKSEKIVPVFKKGSKSSKEHYRPVSILPRISQRFTIH